LRLVQSRSDQYSFPAQAKTLVSPGTSMKLRNNKKYFLIPEAFSHKCYAEVNPQFSTTATGLGSAAEKVASEHLALDSIG
jgi:hypothetical protein